MTNAKFTSIEQYRDVESLNYYKILRESGKTESEALKIIGERSRDNGRTPMQWSAEKFAGFSSVEPWISSPENFKQINVAAEENDADSVLNFYKMLVKFRKENPIVQDGDINFIERGNDNVVAYRRSFAGKELIVLCNFRAANLKLQDKTLREYTASGYKKIIGNYENLADNLRPYEVIVFEK